MKAEIKKKLMTVMMIALVFAPLFFFFVPVTTFSQAVVGYIPGINTSQDMANMDTAREAASRNSSNCSYINPWTWGYCFLEGVVSLSNIIIMPIFGLLTVASSIFMGSMIYFSVNWMDTYLSSSGVVYVWKICRDLANLTLVFVLLYTALNLILDRVAGGDPKKIITNVIIVAMLVNFSGFFVRATVDVSNTISYEFYKKINSDSDVPIYIGLNFLKNTETIKAVNDLLGWTTTNNKPISPSVDSIFITMLGTIIFTVILSFVFLYIGILFLLRTIIIIGAFMIAPFGVLAYAIPGQGKQFENWTKTLSNQLFFAPIMLFLLYAIMKLMEKSSNFNMDTKTWGGTFTSWALLGFVSMMSTLLYFLIVTGLLIKSVGWAKSAGDWGTNFAKKYASGGLGLVAAAGGYAGSRIGKWGAGTATGQKALSKFNNWYGGQGRTAKLARFVDRTPVGEKIRSFAKNPILGTFSTIPGTGADLKMIEKISNLAETSKKSYEKQAEERIFGKDDAKFSDEEVLLNFLRAEESAQKHVYGKMNDKQRGLVEHLLNNSKDEGNRSRIVESIMKTRKMDTASIDLVTDETKKKALQDKARETRDALIANLNSSLGTTGQIHEAEFRTEHHAGTEEAKEAVRKAPVIGLKAKLASFKNELTSKEKNEAKKAMQVVQQKIEFKANKKIAEDAIKNTTNITSLNLDDCDKIRNVSSEDVVELYENDPTKFISSAIVPLLTTRQLKALADTQSFNSNQNHVRKVSETLKQRQAELNLTGATDETLEKSLKYVIRTDTIY